MENQSLIGKMMRGAGLAAAGVAGLVMTSGCMTITDPETGNSKYVAFDPVTGALIQKLGSGRQPPQMTLEQIYAGKAHIVHSKDLGDITYTTCEYIHDANGNNAFDPEEIHGAKDEFKIGDTFAIWIYHTKKAPEGVTVNLIRDGEKFKQESYSPGRDRIYAEMKTDGPTGIYTWQFVNSSKQLIFSIRYKVTDKQ